LTTHRRRWLAGLDLPIEFRRGFPEVLDIPARDYLRYAAALECLAPALAVRLTSFAPGGGDWYGDWEEEAEVRLKLAERLAASWSLSCWVDVEFMACPGTEVFEALLSSPHLTRLRRLVTINNEVGPAVGMVADARFANLRWLDLGGSNSAYGRPADAGFVAIVTSPHLARLEYFDFTANEVGDEGVAALAASPTMARLRSLGLAGNWISPAGLRALSHSAALTSLRHLDLSWSTHEHKPDDAALVALLESPLFPA